MAWSPLARVVALAILVAPATGLAAGSDGGAPVVTYHDDLLTVHMAKTPAADGLRTLATATGAELRGQVPSTGEISIDLDRVPLREGLGRIVGEQNFAITYRSDGRPASIELLGGPLPSVARAPESVVPAPPAAGAQNAATWPPDAKTAAAVATLQALLDRNPSIQLPGDLAAALGTQSATLHDLVKTAATSDDRRVRARSWRLSLRTMRDDPDVWSALVTVVDAAPEGYMRDFMRNQFGPHAEEMTRVLVAHAGPDLRSPAKVALDQLAAQPPDVRTGPAAE